MKLSAFKHWFIAFRPQTLAAGVCPVAIGTAMAFGDGIHHFPTAGLCLAAALAIQIGTNIANDYYDFKKGADTAGRLGPTRVTQAGLIPPGLVKAGFIIAFIAAAAAGYFLIQRGGWPLGVIAATSILSGWLYTAGPRPLGYLGLGDIFVLVFFGPVAVAGTYYAQSLEMNPAVIVAGLGPGLISVAILTVNNYRDYDSDKVSGKRTLAVRFGRAFAQMEYAAALALAALVPVMIYYHIEDHKPILWCSGIILLSLPATRTVFTTQDGPALNRVLAGTGLILIVYSILFSAGWQL